jgi:hypothetical protein
LCSPAGASAQWFGGAYLGANHTQRAAITIEQPAIGRSFTFHDVAFDGRPFESPQYYGWRVGRFFGARQRVGVEFEFIHLKVIAQTAGAYRVTGLSTAGPDDPVVMSEVVERYSMTHGLNFAIVNLVSRTPLGQGPFTLMVRSGAGPTLPHAETTIDGEAREQYEAGGLGAHISAGVDVRAWRSISAALEYKFTLARPEIEVAHGTGHTTAATHQVVIGLAFGGPR